MRRTAHVQRRFEGEHRILDKLAKILPVGEAKPASYPSLAEEIGEAAHAVLRAKRTMEDAGILRVTLTYPTGMSGRVSNWELTMPIALAHQEMDREHERQLDRPSIKAQRRRRRSQVGDLAALQPIVIPSSDESVILLRDAKAYVKRYDTAQEYLRQMRESGIEVRQDALSFARDERLEHIAEVLPAVEDLERKCARLQDQVDRWLDGNGGVSVPAI